MSAILRKVLHVTEIDPVSDTSHPKSVTLCSCIANGTSTVEVILRLGPEVNPDTLQTLKDYVDQNDGILHLANGATARLISVDIINPGEAENTRPCTKRFFYLRYN